MGSCCACCLLGKEEGEGAVVAGRDLEGEGKKTLLLVA